MAKSVIFLAASALCFLSLLCFAYCDSHFSVEGRVYCDTCRTQFVTRLSTYMKGAKVRLQCREREGGVITYSLESETDESGTYHLGVDGEHEEDVCEIVLVKSSDPDCSEVSKDPFLDKSARISLTKNNGITSPVRLANPLGFLRKERVDGCGEVLRELGLTAEDEQ
ncbi:olee1-like protein [Juglans microcarpa x Juglans regia]|uniref:olee1-like protein n=1 Tax=Juglans microcarpa x Juglans regia TaxID=2249226 RepID=UPI001B7EA189|nr:olee1-like protein [Juglans microcarpa x Juglans regia]